MKTTHVAACEIFIKSLERCIRMNEEIRERMINGLRINNRALTQERNQLIKDNMVLSRELAYFKELAADYEEEINRLTSEITDMRNTRKYLTSEEAGARFAQELLGGA